MKNKFTEKIVKIFIMMLCPMLLLSACYSAVPRPIDHTLSGAYSGITFGIDSTFKRLNK